MQRMQRKWRSEAWQKEHPISPIQQLITKVREALLPLRRLLGRFAVPPSYSHFDLAALFSLGQDIEGDYCEFGVYTGHSFVEAYSLVTQLERSKHSQYRRRFFAFDSFEGLPELGETDKTYEQFEAGGYNATKKEFVANLENNGVDLSRVVVTAGWFDQVLTPDLAKSLNLKHVALAMIDCDLYESTVPVLAFLSDLLVDGAVIVFDDWFMYRANPGLGLQKAFYEWQAKNPQLRFSEFPGPFHRHQKAFIVHRQVS